MGQLPQWKVEVGMVVSHDAMTSTIDPRIAVEAEDIAIDQEASLEATESR